MVENEHEPKYPEFGRRLKKAMEDKGLSISEVAKRLGVTFEMVRRYQGGIAMPRQAKMEQLAEMVGVSVVELRDGVMPDALEIVLAAFPPETRNQWRALLGHGKDLTSSQVGELVHRAEDAKLRNEEVIAQVLARRA